jgi:hypothetical protein
LRAKHLTASAASTPAIQFIYALHGRWRTLLVAGATSCPRSPRL